LISNINLHWPASFFVHIAHFFLDTVYTHLYKMKDVLWEHHVQPLL